ncbi:MAG: MATE family multidrug resistance protein [Hyphomicrobiaceae bacterium]|jgi:MATE family multidrug resistance protein
MLRLAGPVALARLGTMGMGVTDTIVVGQLAPEELSFLALGWAPTGVLLVTGIGLLLGVQVLSARALGAGKPQGAGTAWRHGMVLALGFGLLCTLSLWLTTEPLLLLAGIEPQLAEGAAAVANVLALSLPLHFGYMACAYFAEAIHRPGAGTTVIWLANGVNIAVNLALVGSLGALGSAWATVTARAFMMIALGLWVWTSAAGRTHGVRSQGGPGFGVAAILSVGAASALSQLAEAGAFSAMTVIAGRLGAQAVAAYQVLLNALALVFMAALGVAAATAVLTAQASGRADYEEVRSVGWTGLVINSLVMIVAVAAFVLFANPMARAFTSDPALASMIASLLPLVALVLIPDGAQVVAAHALRGRGDNWFPTASHILSYVVVMPPLAWWLAARCDHGVAGLIEAIIVGSLVSVAILMVRMRYTERV